MKFIDVVNDYGCIILSRKVICEALGLVTMQAINQNEAEVMGQGGQDLKNVASLVVDRQAELHRQLSRPDSRVCIDIYRKYRLWPRSRDN